MQPVVEHLPRFGSRIVLRRLSVGDLGEFQSYRHDEAVGRYQGWTPESDSGARTFLEKMQCAPLLEPGKWIQLGIALRTGDALVGDVGLCVKADQTHAEVGITLARSAQRKGLATEAMSLAIALVFELSLVSRIEAITDARNIAAILLLERLGMQREGTQEAVFRGQPCIEHTYALQRRVVSLRQRGSSASEEVRFNGESAT